MSKFLDRLERIWSGEIQPLGFAALAARTKSPAMAIVAMLGQGQLGVGDQDLEGVDAVLFSGADLDQEAETLSRAIEAIANIPWGASVQTATKEGVEQLKGLGCDFIVFGVDEMPVTFLAEQDMGKVLEVDASLSDNLARPIARLPIDAVLIRAEQWPLTVRLLLDYGRLVGLTDKPCMALLPAAPGAGDIEALREAGICGVVTSEQQVLSQIREAVQALPQGRKKKRKGSAILPAVAEWPTEVSEEEEEEEI